MSRKLNPNLFDNMPQTPEPTEFIAPPSKMLMESQKLELQELRNQLGEITSQVEMIRSQTQQLALNLEHRINKQSEAISSIEKGIHRTVTEIDNRLQHTNRKINENSLDYTKMESLLERQNLVIQRFENKLAALQKVVQEKESLLLKYQALFSQLKSGHRLT